MAEKTNGVKAPAPKKAGMTKMEAVKRAMDSLGRDAKPLAIQSYVSDHFNIEMTTAHVSDCKKKLLKRAPGSNTLTPRKKRAAPRPHAPSAHPAPPPQADGGPRRHAGAVLLEDVLTTKELLDRVGAERLRTLIDGLAK